MGKKHWFPASCPLNQFMNSFIWMLPGQTSKARPSQGAIQSLDR